MREQSIPTENIAIRTRDLTKAFGATVAVDSLNLEVERGELFGLVGPDGAGKTTTMRLLAAIMRPDSGEAWVAGHSVLTDEEGIKETIGYMSQRFGLYEDLSVIENIIFYADLYGVAEGERSGRIARLLDFSNLAPFKDRLAGNLSGGMKQKLGLSCALVHTPEILFLDEPTGGVDPVSRRDLWRILYGLLKEGVTIFVSTAYLDEAERCSRIGLMHAGRLIAIDEPRRIREGLGVPMMEILTPDVQRLQEAAGEIAAIRSIGVYGDRVHVGLRGADAAASVVEEIAAKGIRVTGSRPILPSLEDAFIALVTASHPAGGGRG
jgi:ABC-2 type transport system ATP-binding protein